MVARYGLTGARVAAARRRRAAAFASVVGCIAALALSACSSSGSSAASAAPGGASSASGSAGGSAGTDAVKAYGEAQVAKWLKGSEGPLPTSSPKPTPHEKVWVISCGQASVGCATPANAAMDAGKSIGWDMTLYDGKLSVQGWTAGVQAAVAAHADGIILDTLDCPLVKQPLADAKKAGIKVVGISAFDCSDPNYGGGQSMFSAPSIYAPANSTPDALSAAWGQVEADWILAQEGGNANVIYAQPTDILETKLIAQGFEQEIKDHCPSCKLQAVPFTLDDYGTGKLRTDFQTAIQSNPGVNAIASGSTSAMLNAVGPVLQGLPQGQREKIASVTGEGFEPIVTAAEQGKFAQAGVGFPSAWLGWAAVDSVNRVFAGQPQVSSGIGVRLWTVNPVKNLDSATNSYVPAANYVSNYEKIWGVQ